jgi:hypothetical protein
MRRVSEPTLYVVCERCNLVLDPNEPDSVLAVERKAVTGLGAESPEYVDGLQVWFHEGCYPGEPRYRRFTVP